MSTKLFENEEYSLTRFWGGRAKKVCLQITPLNRKNVAWVIRKDGVRVKVGDYIHLTRRQVIEFRDTLNEIIDIHLSGG